MSYSIPDGSQLLAPSVKMTSPGGGSASLLPDALSALNLDFYLPNGYGTSGHALVTDGVGNMSWVDLIDAFADDAEVATNVSSNGNVKLGVSAGTQQVIKGDGTYHVSNNGNKYLTFDPGTQKFDFGSSTYSLNSWNVYATSAKWFLGASAGANAVDVRNSGDTNSYLNLNVTAGVEAFTVGSSSTPVNHTKYTLSDQTILGAAAAAHAWSVKNGSTYYLDLDVTSGNTGFVLGQASSPLGKVQSYTLQDQTILGAAAAAHAWSVKNATDYYLDLDATLGGESLQVGTATLPVKTTVYGNLAALTAANSKPPRLGIGSGTEVLRVGGNLQALPTVPPDFVITNGAETVMISEAVNANFLNEAGTQVRVRFAAKDVGTGNNCQFKFRLKYDTTLLMESAVYTSFANGFTMGEFVVQIVTNGANPTRNVIASWSGTRQSNSFQQSAFVTLNPITAIDFTVLKNLQLSVVGVANNNDTQQLIQCSMDVILPETVSA